MDELVQFFAQYQDHLAPKLDVYDGFPTSTAFALASCGLLWNETSDRRWAEWGKPVA